MKNDLPTRGNETYSQTEEIGLKMITNAKMSNRSSQESPYISNTNTFSQESPKFQTCLHVSVNISLDASIRVSTTVCCRCVAGVLQVCCRCIAGVLLVCCNVLQ